VLVDSLAADATEGRNRPRSELVWPMSRYRIYVAGTANYLSVEHDAASLESLFDTVRDRGYLNATAVEAQGGSRPVLIPFDKISIIAMDEGRRKPVSKLVTSRRRYS
jgi:hypothetical protein